MTLLEKAREVSPPVRRMKGVSAEELELIIALMRGDISAEQAGHAMGRYSAYTMAKICRKTRSAVIAGQLSIQRAV